MATTDVSVNERLALHELIRVGFGRGEDLQLLQLVVTQEPAPLPPASYQLLRECQLREEWRCLNEAKLLAQVEATNLISVNDTARMELAARVQQALQQQLRARSTAQQRPGTQTTAKSLANPRKTGAASSAPSSTQVTCRGLGATPRPKSALAPSRRALTPTKDPNSSAQGKQLLTPQQLRSQLGAKVLPPSPPPVHAPKAPSPAKPSQPHSQSVPHHHHHGQSLNNSPATHPQGQSNSNPASFSSSTTTSSRCSSRSHSNSHTSTAAGALVQEPPPLPHFHRSNPRLNSSWPWSNMKQQQEQQEQGKSRLGSPLVQPKPRPHSACQPSKPQPAGSGGRFETFLRLQGSLLEGLQKHASSGGAKNALQALQQSVGHMQAHFQSCLLQAGEALSVPLPQQQQQQQQQQQHGGSDAAHQGRNPRGWFQQLLLGQLGLTHADTLRLQHLRKEQAARVIQRVVRWHLPLARHRRQVQAARARALALAHQLQSHAATIIQCHWRGTMGRQQACVLRKQRVEKQRREKVQALILRLAATRIQRAWRRHHKQKRTAHILLSAQPKPHPNGASASIQAPATPSAHKGAAPQMVLAPPKRNASAKRSRVTVPKEEECLRGGQTTVAGTSSIVGGHLDARTPAHALECFQETAAGGAAPAAAEGVQVPLAVDGHAPCQAEGARPYADYAYTPQHEAAAACVQAAVRGWLCRRSKELWWKHCSRDIRGRRDMARAWRAHHQFMSRTYEQQGQLLEVVQQEAHASQTAMAQWAAESAQFESAWQQWLSRQCRVAMAQPLPKGWTPFVRPGTEEPCFLDTRTGAMHAHHPGLLQLQPFVAQERSRAEEQMLASQAALARHLQAFQHQSRVAQHHLLQGLVSFQT